MNARTLRALLTLCLTTGLLGPAPATAAPRRPATPQARPTAGAGVSVLLVGDSLMATALGQQLETLLSAIPGVSCHRAAKSATGLARPDHHDWITVAARAVARHHPDFVVILIGSNDGQDLIARPGKGKRPRPVRWGDAAWPAAYRARVLALLRTLGAPGRPVLWLGLPPMRSRSLEQKLAVVRREQKAAVDALGSGSQYVGLFALVRELRDQSPLKARRRLYTRDGVHFSLRGSIRFRRLLEPIFWPWIARALVPGKASPPGSGRSPGRTGAPRSGAARP